MTLGVSYLTYLATSQVKMQVSLSSSSARKELKLSSHEISACF